MQFAFLIDESPEAWATRSSGQSDPYMVRGFPSAEAPGISVFHKGRKHLSHLLIRPAYRRPNGLQSELDLVGYVEYDMFGKISR